MDPATLMALATIGQTVGGGIGGFLGSKNARRDREQRRHEFEQTLGLGKFDRANALRRERDTSGLRDKLLFNLMNRMGMTPGEFVPNDMFNPSSRSPQRGGIDFNALKTMNDQYSRGAGGVDFNMLNQMLGRMGYGPNRPGVGRTVPPPGFGQNPFEDFGDPERYGY